MLPASKHRRPSGFAAFAAALTVVTERSVISRTIRLTQCISPKVVGAVGPGTANYLVCSLTYARLYRH